MEFRDCFVNKIDYLQWGLVETIIDKATARNNGVTDLHLNDFNISMWEHYLIKAIFNQTGG